ncbi:preprotein translocase subunit SecE [Candidatus Pantoea edessiphila]|uniref:Protein translocase subunit SecE n=1 Tax=Candidatus Pantoea edessiphila TaxID=2044610 RepID=A0A2P5SYB9_9GAMM|nr:preprotein translocase subunit SecE [Candidatus Pantoea edessiphila]MBK4775551.1 preprotein translocase subunit SecE [Pantoea sp. Edef]PPI87326.1 preprotein translocase subunit SecE [Candidatus Pantoea edessiphila]
MGNNNEAKVTLFSLEIVKWLIILSLLLTAIIGNYYYEKTALYVRVIAITILLIISVCVLCSTNQGKDILVFIRESKAELKKVVWPTYRETFRITLIVIVITTLMSLLLWGLDNIIVHLVSFITSLRF